MGYQEPDNREHIDIIIAWTTYFKVHTYQMTNGAGSFTGVSAGHTLMASSAPLDDLKMWSVKPGGAAGGMPTMVPY